MGGGQKPRQHRIVDRIGQELPAHVAPFMDGPIDGLAFGRGEGSGRLQSDWLHDKSPA